MFAPGGSAQDLIASHPRRHSDVPILHHTYRVCCVPISEGKVGIISNRFYALVHRQVRVQLYPLVGIAHKGEMKTAVPGILHPSKFCLEAWLYWIGVGHAVFGTEVERLVVPLAIDIDDVIELRILLRWLDIFRLQYCLDEFIRLGGDFHFQRFGQRRGRCFAWVHRPRIDFLWHPIPPFTYKQLDNWLVPLFWVDNGSIANSLLAFQEVLFTDEGANIVPGYGRYGSHGRATCSKAARKASYFYYNFAFASSSFNAGRLRCCSRSVAI